MPSKQAKHANAARSLAAQSARGKRAAQFMPFAALNGYYDLVRKQERQVEPRKEHTEEDIAQLSLLLSQIEKGSVVKILHYQDDAYVSSCGIVSEIVPELRFVRIIKEIIHFEDIYQIEIL